MPPKKSKTKAKEPEIERSGCCGMKALVYNGKEGTSHYYCDYCGETCDLLPKKSSPKVDMARQGATSTHTFSVGPKTDAERLSELEEGYERLRIRANVSVLAMLLLTVLVMVGALLY